MRKLYPRNLFLGLSAEHVLFICCVRTSVNKPSRISSVREKDIPGTGGTESCFPAADVESDKDVLCGLRSGRHRVLLQPGNGLLLRGGKQTRHHKIHVQQLGAFSPAQTT